MCGISGIVCVGDGRARVDLVAALRRMTDAQAHRGPDDAGEGLGIPGDGSRPVPAQAEIRQFDRHGAAGRGPGHDGHGTGLA